MSLIHRFCNRCDIIYKHGCCCRSTKRGNLLAGLACIWPSFGQCSIVDLQGLCIFKWFIFFIMFFTMLLFVLEHVFCIKTTEWNTFLGAFQAIQFWWLSYDLAKKDKNRIVSFVKRFMVWNSGSYKNCMSFNQVRLVDLQSLLCSLIHLFTSCTFSRFSHISVPEELTKTYRKYQTKPSS